jgi:diadenosine tetraphosphatase ApaH/serine/threonine PP2A family protein phosphatase
MKALLLSDIHANIDALQAVLTAAPAYDFVWNLGDIVGYNAAPAAVLEQCQALGNVFVRGNHDSACAVDFDLDTFNGVAAAAVRWTRKQLTPEMLAWLQQLPRGPLPPGRSADGAEPSVHCMHGSPCDEDEYMLSEADAIAQLPCARARINFFGHTHIQGGFAFDPQNDCAEILPGMTGETRAERWDLPLRPGLRYFLNPGSVGQPRDGDWRAAFAVYDDAAELISFWRVPYDVRRAQIRIQRAGLPDMLAMRLRTGR